MNSGDVHHSTHAAFSPAAAVAAAQIAPPFLELEEAAPAHACIEVMYITSHA